MDDATQAGLTELRREVSETRFIVEMLLMRGLSKDDRQAWTADKVQEWVDDSLERREFRRAFGERYGVYGKGLSNDAVEGLIREGLHTLPEVAQQPRQRVASIHGVGRVSLQRLDAVLSERELTWAEAA